MRKALIAAGVIVGFALLARRAARGFGGCNFADMIERMPEDAPPKWMFRNITAIRENTDRILEKLETEPASEQTREPASIYAASAD
jgi:ketosteroid isomerase-like protein